MTEKRFEYDPSINHFTDTETNKEYCEYNIDKICDLLNEYDDNLRMCHEKALYWRNKAEDIFGDMKTNTELKRENIRLKKELKEMKDKAYEYGCEWIYSVCGFTQDEEKDKLRQEIYGEKAEQKRLQELKKEIENTGIYSNKSFYETVKPVFARQINNRPQDKVPEDKRICRDCLYNSQGKCVVSEEYVDEEGTCYGWEPK